MSFSIFPRELLDLFVSTVVEDPTNKSPIATLKACSLVCKSLGVSARARLFSTITINLDPTAELKPNTIKALEEALGRDKELARGVRSLQIHFWNTHHWHSASVHSLTSWVLGLPGVLHALRSSEAETMRGSVYSMQERPSQLHMIAIRIFGGEFIEWEAFHEYFRSALKELCMTSSITTFRLEGIFLFDIHLILKYMPNLKTLDMIGCEFESFPKVLPHLQSGETVCPQLEELHIQETTVRAHSGQSAIPEKLFGSLKILEIQPNLNRSRKLQSDIWNSCSTSLRTLKLIRTLELEANVLPTFPQGDLYSFSSLRTLIVEIPCEGLAQCTENLGWVSELLSRPTPSALQTIRFDIISHIDRSFFVKYESGHLEPKALLVAALDNLDRVLSKDTFKSLFTVTFRVLLFARKFQIPIDNPSFLPPQTKVVDLTPRLRRTTQKLSNQI